MVEDIEVRNELRDGCQTYRDKANAYSSAEGDNSVDNSAEKKHNVTDCPGASAM